MVGDDEEPPFAHALSTVRVTAAGYKCNSQPARPPSRSTLTLTVPTIYRLWPSAAVVSLEIELRHEAGTQ